MPRFVSHLTSINHRIDSKHNHRVMSNFFKDKTRLIALTEALREQCNEVINPYLQCQGYSALIFNDRYVRKAQLMFATMLNQYHYELNQRVLVSKNNDAAAKELQQCILAVVLFAYKENYKKNLSADLARQPSQTTDLVVTESTGLQAVVDYLKEVPAMLAKPFDWIAPAIFLLQLIWLLHQNSCRPSQPIAVEVPRVEEVLDEKVSCAISSVEPRAVVASELAEGENAVSNLSSVVDAPNDGDVTQTLKDITKRENIELTPSRHASRTVIVPSVEPKRIIAQFEIDTSNTDKHHSTPSGPTVHLVASLKAPFSHGSSRSKIRTLNSVNLFDPTNNL